MSVDNRTPFPALAFRQYNLAGQLLGVVVARGTFRLSPTDGLELADVQRPLVMSDIYAGDPHETPQIACTDLAPFKPGTDVTFVGSAHSPDGQPHRSWECGLTVGSVGRRLRVTGPRVWKAKARRTWVGLLDPTKEWVLDGWALTEPEPVTEVPIDWRLASGGPLYGSEAESQTHDARNPIGRGHVDGRRFPDVQEWPAPQIEDFTAPVCSPSDDREPVGLGPVSPFWSTRLRHAGTFDAAWKSERHPLMPADFDFAFWQAAPKGLVANPWLESDEPFKLENLVSGRPVVRGRLPGLRLAVEIDQGTGPARGPMVLDGVHFEFTPEAERVSLTWRVGFPWPERKGRPILTASRSGSGGV